MIPDIRTLTEGLENANSMYRIYVSIDDSDFILLDFHDLVESTKYKCLVEVILRDYIHVCSDDNITKINPNHHSYGKSHKLFNFIFDVNVIEKGIKLVSSPTKQDLINTFRGIYCKESKFLTDYVKSTEV